MRADSRNREGLSSQRRGKFNKKAAKKKNPSKMMRRKKKTQGTGGEEAESRGSRGL